MLFRCLGFRNVEVITCLLTAVFSGIMAMPKSFSMNFPLNFLYLNYFYVFICDDNVVLGNQIRQDAVFLLQWVYLFLTVCKIALLVLRGYYTEL